MMLRFAPSPTGFLHVGNIRTLLLNWAYAQQNKAAFLLRFDDTDVTRTKDEYIDAIYNDLKWLNLNFDQTIYQSKRLALYNEVIENLKKKELLYPCYETPEELAIKRQYQLNSGKPPIYDRSSLILSPSAKDKLIQGGRKPHWRFKLSNKTMRWNDIVQGNVEISCEHFSDPILVRENNTPVFTLSGAIDDVETGITHIIRGNDHVSNTAVQLQIMENLPYDMKNITFAHLPLITGAKGDVLSKRLGSLTIKELRNKGYEPLAIISYLSQLGTANSGNPYFSNNEFCNQFQFKNFGKSSPKFSINELHIINNKFLANVEYKDVDESVKPILHPKLNDFKIAQKFWQAVQKNLFLIHDIEIYQTICFEKINPVINDLNYINQVKELLPTEPWSDDTWMQWIAQIKIITKRKGRELFQPLRQALTGQNSGPEMGKLFPFIGYEKAYDRLSGKIA